MCLDTVPIGGILKRTVARFTSLGSVLVAATAGLLFPEMGSQLNWLVSPIVIILIYFSFISVTLNFEVVQSRIWDVCIALLISLGLLPILAWALTSLIASTELGTGLILMVVTPTTAGSAIVWTQLSGSDVQLATIVSVASILLAPITMPILLLIFTHHGLQISPLPLFTNLSIVLGAAFVLRHLVPETPLDRTQKEYVTQFGITLLIYISISSNNVLQYSVTSSLFAVGVSAVILFVGYLLTNLAGIISGVQQESKTALFFSSSLKNLGVALLSAATFTSKGIVSGVVIYYVVQQVLSSFIVDV